MKASLRQSSVSRAHGQAMAEFNVAAVFVLLPVFLLIPLVAKYIDLRHSAVQAARTVAWERTVWFERSPNGTDTVPKGSGAPARSDAEVQRVVANRVLGSSGRPLANADWQTDMVDGELNPFWKDHRGERLVNLPANEPAAAQRPEGELPTDAYAALRTFDRVESAINGVLAYGDTVGKQIEKALNSLGIKVSLPRAPQVDLIGKYHLEGYYAPVSSLPVNNVTNLASFGQPGGAFDDLNLVMRGQSALIADGWTAEGAAQFADWTDDYVPTRALRGLLAPFQDIVSSLPVIGHPELATDSLDMGYIDMGPVPTSDVAPNCPRGACTYE